MQLSLTVCFCHVMYAFYSESTLYSCLNVKELRTPYRQVLRTQLNHLASLAKWMSVRLRTRWFRVRLQLQSLQLSLIDNN